MRTLVVHLGDTHGGHVLGLLAPGTELPEEDELGKVYRRRPTLTPVQEYLWKCYLDDFARVKSMLAEDDRLIVAHGGDLCHGNDHPERLVTTSAANQVRIGVAVLKPWLDVSQLKALRIAHGTAPHNFGEGSAEELAAELLCEGSKFDVRALRHGLMVVDGVRIDYAHHGPVSGSRNWLRGNSAGHALKSMMMDELDAGRAPPRVVIRHHRHVYARATVHLMRNGIEHTSTLIVCPSYCGMTDFARKVTQSAYILHNGMVVLEIDGGRLVDIHHQPHICDLRTEEEIL